MDNRKRIRLAGVGGGGVGAVMHTSSVNSDHSLSSGNMLSHSNATTMLTNIGGGGHSYYLTSGSETLELPANVFLTICGDGDDNSDDESQEFLIETTTTTTTTPCHDDEQQQTHIKQEPTTTMPMPMQYRLVNPRLQKTSTASQPPPLISTTHHGTTTLLPSNLQLPSGCEIYLVKEYVDDNTSPTTTTASRSSTLLGSEGLLPGTSQATTIKLEPNVCLTQATTQPVAPLTTTSAMQQQQQFVRGSTANVPCLVATSTKLNQAQTVVKSAAATATTTTVAATTNGVSAGGDDMKLNKRSYILEAYKKRDDKRRATHNEVERRRRDKINSWIFKLKEMLPSEMAAANETAAAMLSPQQQPRKLCDSKSQILIKACEYIKAMQDELKNLRECLTANDHETQKLKDELHLYRTTQISPNNNNNENNSSSKYRINLASNPSSPTVMAPTTSTTLSSSASSPSTNGTLMLAHLNDTSFYSLVDPSSSSSSIGLKENVDDDDEDEDNDIEEVDQDEVDSLSTGFVTKRELIITDYVD